MAANQRHRQSILGCHVCFAVGMAVALVGFVLIWSPWHWLMLTGAATSCTGSCLSVAAAWRRFSLIESTPVQGRRISV